MNRKLLNKSNECFDLLDKYQEKINKFRHEFVDDASYFERLGDQLLPLIDAYSKIANDMHDELGEKLNILQGSHMIFNLHNKKFKELQYEHYRLFRKVEKLYNSTFETPLRQDLIAYRRSVKNNS